VICPRVESSAQAVKIAERIAAATTATVDVGTGVAELRTRVGVARGPDSLKRSPGGRVNSPFPPGP